MLPKILYEREYDRWLEIQIKLLKEKNFSELDIANLCEELEDLGRSEKARIKSLAKQIIIHKLFVDYWENESDYNKAHWQAEISAFQDNIRDNLTTNYKLLLEKELEDIYQKARKFVLEKSNLKNIPQESPYSLDKILGD